MYTSSGRYTQPNGFQSNIIRGRTVKAAKSAINIAVAVRTPKYMVGMKLDNTKIEKPKMMVIVV